MKKIITSLGMLVFVGALVVGATGAFFSDTETSTGNVFTAGAIDLTVDSEQHYNGAVCVPNENQNPEVPGDEYVWDDGAEDGYPVAGTTCTGTWEATNLGAHKFFNFDDIKPGDEGENTISLHVDSNDAYACVDVSITSNDDVDCTDPETEAEILACQNSVPSAEFDGELAQNLEFFAWADDGAIDGFGDENDPTEGDNIWQNGELPLFSNLVGPASDVLDGESYTLADSNTGPLEGNTTSYIGLTWCAGDLTVVGPGVLSCDGAQMGNEAQTDEMIADIAFRVEQARNNEDFSCEPQEEVLPATLTLEKQVNQDGIDAVSDASWTLSATGDVVVTGTDNDPAASPAITNIVVPAGAYTLTESAGPGGFTLTGISCTDGTLVGNVVTLDPGDNAICTFTNLETVQNNN